MLSGAGQVTSPDPATRRPATSVSYRAASSLHGRGLRPPSSPGDGAATSTGRARAAPGTGARAPQACPFPRPVKETRTSPSQRNPHLSTGPSFSHPHRHISRATGLPPRPPPRPMPHTPHCSRSSLSTPTPVRGALLAPTTAPSRPHTPAPAPAAATYPGACMRPMMAATKKSEPGGATALPAPLPQERASPLPAPPRTTANQRTLRAVGGLRGRRAPRLPAAGSEPRPAPPAPASAAPGGQ